MSELRKALQIFDGGLKAVAARSNIKPINVARVLMGEFNNETVISETEKLIEEKIEKAEELLSIHRSKRAA